MPAHGAVDTPHHRRANKTHHLPPHAKLPHSAHTSADPAVSGHWHFPPLAEELGLLDDGAEQAAAREPAAPRSYRQEARYAPRALRREPPDAAALLGCLGGGGGGGGGGVLSSEDGWTALHYAAAGFHLGAGAALDELLGALSRAPLRDRSAYLDARTDVGATALQLACWRPQPAAFDAAQLLLAAGADPNAADAYGRAPLHAAAMRASKRLGGAGSKSGTPDIVRALLARGADASLADANGWTPLHFACCHGDRGIEAIEELLKAGADPFAKTAEGLCALGLVLALEEQCTRRDRCEDAVLALRAARVVRAAVLAAAADEGEPVHECMPLPTMSTEMRSRLARVSAHMPNAAERREEDALRAHARGALPALVVRAPAVGGRRAGGGEGLSREEAISRGVAALRALWPACDVLPRAERSAHGMHGQRRKGAHGAGDGGLAHTLSRCARYLAKGAPRDNEINAALRRFVGSQVDAKTGDIDVLHCCFHLRVSVTVFKAMGFPQLGEAFLAAPDEGRKRWLRQLLPVRCYAPGAPGRPPLLVWRVANLHPESILRNFTQAEIVAAMMSVVVRALQHEAEGRSEDSAVTVYDFRHFSLSKVKADTSRALGDALRDFLASIPDMQSKQYMVHTPLYFKAASAFALSMVDENTARKIVVSAGAKAAELARVCGGPDGVPPPLRPHGGEAAAQAEYATAGSKLVRDGTDVTIKHKGMYFFRVDVVDEGQALHFEFTSSRTVAFFINREPLLGSARDPEKGAPKSGSRDAAQGASSRNPAPAVEPWEREFGYDARTQAFSGAGGGSSVEDTVLRWPEVGAQHCSAVGVLKGEAGGRTGLRPGTYTLAWDNMKPSGVSSGNAKLRYAVWVSPATHMSIGYDTFEGARVSSKAGGPALANGAAAALRTADLAYQHPSADGGACASSDDALFGSAAAAAASAASAAAVAAAELSAAAAAAAAEAAYAAAAEGWSWCRSASVSLSELDRAGAFELMRSGSPSATFHDALPHFTPTLDIKVTKRAADDDATVLNPHGDDELLRLESEEHASVGSASDMDSLELLFPNGSATPGDSLDTDGDGAAAAAGGSNDSAPSTPMARHSGSNGTASRMAMRLKQEEAAGGDLTPRQRRRKERQARRQAQRAARKAHHSRHRVARGVGAMLVSPSARGEYSGERRHKRRWNPFAVCLSPCVADAPAGYVPLEWNEETAASNGSAVVAGGATSKGDGALAATGAGSDDAAGAHCAGLGGLQGANGGPAGRVSSKQNLHASFAAVAAATAADAAAGAGTASEAAVRAATAAAEAATGDDVAAVARSCTGAARAGSTTAQDRLRAATAEVEAAREQLRTAAHARLAGPLQHGAHATLAYSGPIAMTLVALLAAWAAHVALVATGRA